MIRTASIVSAIALCAITDAAEPPRARPPVFTAEDRAAFFDDGFATLVGERPTARTAVANTPSTTAPAKANVRWSDLIAADTLETEIKRQSSRLAKTVRSSSSFKAGGYRDASDALAVLATLFAVTAEHDNQPRWADTAESLRTLLTGAAETTDAATDAALQLATKRARDFEDLVRGGRPTVPEATDPFDWSELASRSALMRRIATAEEERLRGAVSSERAFRRSYEDVRHEAQLLAALAEAALRPEADDFDDPDYQEFARQLRDASVRLAAAAEAEDQPAAAAAMTAVSRSCVDCHADYRG